MQIERPLAPYVHLSVAAGHRAFSLLAAAGCIALAWTIVFLWRIGPVIAVLDVEAGRGIHSGDLLALPLLYLGWMLQADAAGTREPVTA